MKIVHLRDSPENYNSIPVPFDQYKSFSALVVILLMGTLVTGIVRGRPRMHSRCRSMQLHQPLSKLLIFMICLTAVTFGAFLIFGLVVMCSFKRTILRMYIILLIPFAACLCAISLITAILLAKSGARTDDTDSICESTGSSVQIVERHNQTVYRGLNEHDTAGRDLDQLYALDNQMHNGELGKKLVVYSTYAVKILLLMWILISLVVLLLRALQQQMLYYTFGI